ncbi:hypothetical protein BKA01_002350 [Pseudonocardia eucalypti]|nr:hypothetical protein [Pseudonocardia eucalypti]
MIGLDAPSQIRHPDQELHHQHRGCRPSVGYSGPTPRIVLKGRVPRCSG